MPNIRPSSELRNNYANIMKISREQNQPIFLTVNGKGDSVIMPIEIYEKELAIRNINLMLEEAETDRQNGKLFSHDEVFAEIQSVLEKLQKA